MKSNLGDGRKEGQKRALIVTTVSGFVPQFEMNNVRILQELGYRVYYASNFRNPSFGKDNSRLDGTGIVRCQVDLERSPLRVFAAVRAYRQLKRLMRELSFELLHCHTPMGGALARLAAASVDRERKLCRRRKYAEIGNKSLVKKVPRCRVIYTAHGFHFYKGAPLWNWLVYYPAERWLARYTDVLITINKEDYGRARSFPVRSAEAEYVDRLSGSSRTGGRKEQEPQADCRIKRGDQAGGRKEREPQADCRMKRRPEGSRGGQAPAEPKQIYRINGVGIDVEKYQKASGSRRAGREKLGVNEDEFLLLSVGELSKRKNHRAVIRALAELSGKKQAERTKIRRSSTAAEKKWTEKAQVKRYKAQDSTAAEKRWTGKAQVKRYKAQDSTAAEKKWTGKAQVRRDKEQSSEAAGRNGFISRKWKYLIVGSGAQKRKLERQIQRAGLQKNIVLTGYRTNVEEFLAAADCFVFPSKQEGLPVALLEAAAAGLPCIASNIRGNREVLQDGEGLFPLRNIKRLKALLEAAYRFAVPCEGGLHEASCCCAEADNGLVRCPVPVFTDVSTDRGKTDIIPQRNAERKVYAGQFSVAAQLQKFDQREIRRKMKKIYEQNGTTQSKTE